MTGFCRFTFYVPYKVSQSCSVSPFSQTTSCCISQNQYKLISIFTLTTFYGLSQFVRPMCHSTNYRISVSSSTCLNLLFCTSGYLLVWNYRAYSYCELLVMSIQLLNCCFRYFKSAFYGNTEALFLTIPVNLSF